MRFPVISLLVFAAACGGGNSDNHSGVDAPTGHPADSNMTNHDSTTTTDGTTTTTDGSPVTDGSSVTCTAETFGTQDFLGNGSGFVAFTAPVNVDLGDGGAAHLQVEFYDMISNLTLPIDLAAGVQADYATCAACVRVRSPNAAGDMVREYYQSGGTMTLTEDPFTNGKMIGTITNLALVEVMIDSSTSASTPVAGGKCIAAGTVTLNADSIPNAYTCVATTYNDGTTCNCKCGSPDPDCGIAGAPVVGCTANQQCLNDACIDPPANDTCQTATPLTIGTPMTGTTVGGTSNYDANLATVTCTNTTKQAGADVAYSVTLTAGTSYTLTLTGVDAAFDPSISLLGPGLPAVCDATTSACVAGADVGLEGENETFAFTPTTTGTYYVIVDSYYTAEVGAFTVTVAPTPAPPAHAPATPKTKATSSHTANDTAKASAKKRR